MNREETAQVLAVLAAAFPWVNVTRETAEVYHDVLQDVPGVAAREAVRTLLLTAERWPAPATIRRKVAEMTGALAPSAGQAWGEVQEQARLVGWMGSPQFSHPAIADAVRSIGWRSVCLSEMPDTIRAHFLRAYEVEQQQHDGKTLGAALSVVSGAERGALGVAR